LFDILLVFFHANFSGGISSSSLRDLIELAANARDPLSRTYHDTEWGNFSLGLSDAKPDSYFFEMLTLESAQAGLSWSTILTKRENYRLAYKDWNIAAVAAFTEEDVKR